MVSELSRIALVSSGGSCTVNGQIRTYNRSIEEADPRGIQAFDKCFNPYGGRLSGVGADTEWFKLRYWDYVKKFRTIPAFQKYLNNLHFDFVDNRTLNAIATQDDEHYLIGCFLGAMRNLQGLFIFLLSCPDVLTQIGNAGNEKRWLRSLKSCSFVTPLETILTKAEINETPPPDFPIDPERKLYAHRLAILAMDFLFFHEMGHLTNGHLEFLEATGKRSAVEELGASRNSGSSALDDQALEINADSAAVMIMTQEWFQFRKVLPPGSTFRTVTEAIESLVLALTAVFLIFDPGRTTLADYRTATHPHPAVRLANVYFGTCQIAKQTSRKALRNLERSWKRGLQNAAAMFSALELGAAIWHTVAGEGEMIHSEYLRVARRFQEIDRSLRPDLKRFQS